MVYLKKNCYHFCFNLAETHPTLISVVVRNCSNGFYHENNSTICVPDCYTWTQYSSRSVSISVDVITFISSFVGFMASITMIVISLFKRKIM